MDNHLTFAPESTVYMRRSGILATLAATDERIQVLLATRADIRYESGSQEDGNPAGMTIRLDIDGAPFGRAVLDTWRGEELRLASLDTRNTPLAKTAPGAGSLLMLAALAHLLSGDLRRMGWRSTHVAHSFYVDKFLYLILPLRETWGLRWGFDWDDFTIERTDTPEARDSR